MTESPLLTAHRLVHEDRGADYGAPLDDFGRTATAASAFLSEKLRAPLSPEDIALIMICVKLSRQANKAKLDNLVDCAGYVETWQMVLDERARRAGA